MIIYILKLEEEKYYVGKTENLDERIKQHFTNNGTVWTKKYKPIKIIETINTNDPFDEDKYTIKYMKRYEIDNVRGGSFCQLELSESEKQIIQKMINGSEDKCYNCGNFDHFIKDCPKETDYVIVSEPKKKKGFFEKFLSGISEIIEDYITNDKICSRCGRNSHTVRNCFAQTHFSGRKL